MIVIFLVPGIMLVIGFVALMVERRAARVRGRMDKT